MQAVLDAFRLAAPEAMLVVAACSLLCVVPFLESGEQSRRIGLRKWCGFFSLTVLLVAWLLSARQSTTAPIDLAHSFFRHDSLTWFVQMIGFSAGVLLLLLSWNQIGDERAVEFHACLLLNVDRKSTRLNSSHSSVSRMPSSA